MISRACKILDESIKGSWWHTPCGVYSGSGGTVAGLMLGGGHGAGPAPLPWRYDGAEDQAFETAPAVASPRVQQ